MNEVKTLRPTERVLNEWFAAFERNDMDAARNLYRPDAVLHVAQPPELAGDHVGFDALLSWFARKTEIEGPDFSYRVHDYMGSDQHVVALIEINARSRSWHQLAVYHVDAGQITEIWLQEERPD